jgi:DNA modification methylase
MILHGDALLVLRGLESNSIDCCITSPPYFGLRDYGSEGQIGREDTFQEYIEKLSEVFMEVKRVLKPQGTLWLNLGDSYASASKNRTPEQAARNSSLQGGKNNQAQALHQKSKLGGGLKRKDLMGIPWRVAFRLQQDGWYLRQDIIWSKPNPMPESVTDRCTKAHEYIFLLSKSEAYFFNHEAIKEPSINDSEMRNKRSVWTVTPKPFKEAHFATYPEDLIEPCVLSGSPEDGIILDPFFGSGTTGAVAIKKGRSFIGIEINSDFIEIAAKRLGLISKEGTQLAIC